MLRADQDRGRVEALGVEQRGQQRVLVLAIAVAVGQHFAGRMRLNASQAERQAHVANVARDVVVERLHLRHVVGLAFDQRSGFGLHAGVGHAAVVLQPGVPRAQLLPALEGGQLDGWNVVVAWPSSFSSCLSSSSFRLRVGPAVDAAVALVGDLGIVARLGLQLDLAVLGDVDLQLLVENDSLLREVVAGPELAGSERG